MSEESHLKDRFYFTSKTNEIWGINAFNMEKHFNMIYNYSEEMVNKKHYRKLIDESPTGKRPFQLNYVFIDLSVACCDCVAVKMLIFGVEGITNTKPADHIIRLMFDEPNMEKYNKIFFFLIRIRRINDLLKTIWDFTNSANLRRSSLDVYTRIRKVQLLRHKMQQFVNNLMQYILNEVVDKLWTSFHQKIRELCGFEKDEELKNMSWKSSFLNLNNTVRFEDLLSLHKGYLNSALNKCFILKQESKVGELIKQMLGQIQELYKLCIHVEFEDEVKSNSFISKVSTVDRSFDQYSIFFYKMIRALSESGNFKELFLRIDFNNYFSKIDDQPLY